MRQHKAVYFSLLSKYTNYWFVGLWAQIGSHWQARSLYLSSSSYPLGNIFSRHCCHLKPDLISVTCSLSVSGLWKSFSRRTGTLLVCPTHWSCSLTSEAGEAFSLMGWLLGWRFCKKFSSRDHWAVAQGKTIQWLKPRRTFFFIIIITIILRNYQRLAHSVSFAVSPSVLHAPVL